MSFASNAQSLVQAAALPMEFEPISLAGLATSIGDTPSIPGLNTDVSGGKTLDAAETKTGRDGEATLPGVSAFELQILNQFFLVHKVLNEIIEDMSSLNRLGAERVSALKKSAAVADGAKAPLESLAARERALETKISDNMVFCVVRCVTFLGEAASCF